MHLFLLSFIIGFLAYMVFRGIRWELNNKARLKARQADLEHQRAEIEFMQPMFRRLYAEALMHWHNGDYAAYEKTRQQVIILEHRWKREVTSKLKRNSHNSYYP